jgi:hypothetical protein
VSLAGDKLVKYQPAFMNQPGGETRRRVVGFFEYFSE